MPARASSEGYLGIKRNKRGDSALQREKCYTCIKDYYHKSVLRFEMVSTLGVLCRSKSGIWPAQKENFPRNKSTCPFPLSNADDNGTT